jgi:hypothetical protein
VASDVGLKVELRKSENALAKVLNPAMLSKKQAAFL